MFDAILGGLLMFAAGTGALLIALYFILWPIAHKRKHDYWCHRDNLEPGDDHGNQEPHV
ncbi:MAG: hypothetical protein VW270_07070 [Candidatus Poseidoniales archaeon]